MIKRLAIIWLLAVATLGVAQEVIRVDVGLVDVVVDAWNPIVVHGRDLPGYTLQIDVLLGTLRETERIETHTFTFPPGRGTVFLEEYVRLPADTRAVAWRVRTTDSTLASGQISAATDSAEPVVVVVGGAPPLTLLGAGLRAGELQSHELSTDPAAYDGVATVILTGAGAAPSLESIVAAATMGAQIFVPAATSPQFSALAQLAGTSVGAGAITLDSPNVEAVTAAVDEWKNRTSERSATLAVAPELPKLPFSGRNLTIALLVYLVLARALLYVPGLPGVVSVLLLVVAVGAAAFLSLQHSGSVTATNQVRVANGGLARVDTAHIVVYRGGDTVREFALPAVERAP